MHLDMITGGAVLGLLVGVLVGLTGIGGGLLLVPLLISVLGVPPIVAVGSDAVISCITKLGAGGVHWYHGNVRWRLVFRLACGSLPGAILGVLILRHISGAYGSAINSFLRVSVGILLVVIPTSYLAGPRLRTAPLLAGTPPRDGNLFAVTMIGFIAGLLTGVTSIGAGSVILMALMIFCRISPAATVSTDIIHGVLLAGVTGLLQFKLLGNVDLLLVGSVLAGSVPGGLVGAYLASHVSSVKLKPIVCTLIVLLGVRMLWGVVAHVN